MVEITRLEKFIDEGESHGWMEPDAPSLFTFCMSHNDELGPCEDVGLPLLYCAD